MASDAIEFHGASRRVLPTRTVVVDVMIREAKRHLRPELIQQPRIALIRERPRLFVAREARRSQRDVLRVQNAEGRAYAGANHGHQRRGIWKLQHDVAGHWKLLKITLGTHRVVRT